eukprot:gnl/TRDRNA2_/TRDRNA2_140952_c1_seq1.p1 gnl/TRDRNA2_/TRDRNA2_140952_c1~~gnl/TRDRNA2_/TRDRNA2_140952_c1_seq1.p1  ORF type:complete len:247 (-),score=21.65 gnl/TRDRNA2_/TRDRNA2_140952_c1_seq1:563-1240(-)
MPMDAGSHPEDAPVVWEWLGPRGTWQPYGASACRVLESAHKASRATCTIATPSGQQIVDLQNMTQHVRGSGGAERKVRRVVPDGPAGSAASGAETSLSRRGSKVVADGSPRPAGTETDEVATSSFVTSSTVSAGSAAPPTSARPSSRIRSRPSLSSARPTQALGRSSQASGQATTRPSQPSRHSSVPSRPSTSNYSTIATLKALFGAEQAINKFCSIVASGCCCC